MLSILGSLMKTTNTLLFPLPFTSPDDSAVNETLKLFFSHLVRHYDSGELNESNYTEQTLCDYITTSVINEIELLYQYTNGYLYTGTPQSITELENCVYVNHQYFDVIVKYVAHHMYNTILPTISTFINNLLGQGHNVTNSNMKWHTYNPTTLTVEVTYY